MSQKQVVTRTVNSVVVVSLFLMAGCGKPKAKSTEKTKKPVAIIKPAKVQTKIVVDPSNIAINPSFEEAKTFDSGLYKKGKHPKKKPVGWITKGQVLDDFTGWATDEAHTGKRSLKIENIGGTKAYWQGNPIVFKKSANAFKASIWTKTKEIKNESRGGKLQLVFDVYFKGKDNNEIMRKISIDLAKKDHNWEKITKKALFSGNITKVVPYLYFSNTIGTVWFDDISVNSINIDASRGKVLFDSNSKKSTFNIPPSYTPINAKHLSSDLSAEAKEIALDEQSNIYEVKGSKSIISSDFLAINKNNIYRMSGMFKSDSETKSLLYFGYMPYTKSKKFITPPSVSVLANTETELYKPCLKGDIVLYIKDGVSWISNKTTYVAFDIDNSGNLSDLPNFKLSKINKIEKGNGHWKIFLVKPCAKSYPVNTKVREHFFGSYEYIRSCHVPDTWTEYAEIITTKKEFINGGKLFPPGTSYIKISILANLGQSKETLILKDISFDNIIIL